MIKLNKIKLKMIVLIFVLAVTSTNLFGQGLNNNYPIDSTDIKNIINILGIEAFKFPIKKQTEKCKLKIIEECYINHKLSSKSVMTDGMENYLPLMNESENTLRIYKQGINDSTIELRLDLEGITVSRRTQFGKDTIGMQQCRAYSDFQPVKGKTVPIFIWYAAGKGRTEPMHCPGNSPLARVAELYDFVIAISIELEDLKGK
jgi:hypothetical protein